MLLIIDDDLAVRTSLTLLLEQEGYVVVAVADPHEALATIARQRPQLVLLDLNFSSDTSGEEGLELLSIIGERQPGLPVVVLTGWGTIDLAVRGMRLGARDFLTKPWNNDHLLNAIATHLQLERAPEIRLERQALDQRYQLEQIVGQSPQLLEVLQVLGRVAPTDAPVLITGESGVGKELIAEAIHLNSGRRQQPFVKVNLGGISTSLFESELFGHVRGAFTDAKTDRMGRFEQAQRGSIFLDEIGELDLASQVKLLRVLQDRRFEPLGSSKTRQVDVRIVCATNRNLTEMVQAGTFREDLFYRINLITLHLPPLRERPEDIPLLADFFINNLRAIYQRPGLKLTPAAAQWLRTLHLPGNIRQLKNLVERTVLLSSHDELNRADFQQNLDQSNANSDAITLPAVGSITLEALEKAMIIRALAVHQQRIAPTARALGITRFALYRRLEKYGIPYEGQA